MGGLFFLEREGESKPDFVSAPGRKFSLMISADAISFSMRARSFGSARSAVTLFLLRLNSEKKPAPEPISLRVLSPPGGSTLITSAPRSPRLMPQVGPMTVWVNSTTRIPVGGRRGGSDRVELFGPQFAAGLPLELRTAARLR